MFLLLTSLKCQNASLSKFLKMLSGGIALMTVQKLKFPPKQSVKCMSKQISHNINPYF